MTAPWIKVRVDLWDDPHVVRMASTLGSDRPGVIGRLFRLWTLADAYTVDGVLEGYSATDIDAAVGMPGFSTALEAVGWLSIGQGFVAIPRFDEHNGSSAKKRAQAKNRVAKHREAGGCNAPSVTRALPDRETETETEREGDLVIDHLDLSFLREEAAKIAVTVSPRTADDRRLLVRACSLVSAGELSEHVLRDAVEAVRRAGKVRDRVAYFFGAIAYGAYCDSRKPTKSEQEDARRRLTRALQRIQLPPGAADFPTETARRPPTRPAGGPEPIGLLLAPGSKGGR